MSDIQVMEGRPGESFLDEFYDSDKGYFVPTLPADDSALKWRELVRDFHRANIRGQGQIIAVVDSGFDARHPVLKNSVSGQLDLTGEGIQDLSGHGTLVSLL
jgi:subtilisin family serine protease